MRTTLIHWECLRRAEYIHFEDPLNISLDGPFSLKAQARNVWQGKRGAGHPRHPSTSETQLWSETTHDQSVGRLRDNWKADSFFFDECSEQKMFGQENEEIAIRDSEA